MDAIERANHLMDTAEFESVVVFDRCAVVLAQLESGEIVMEASGSRTAEEFDVEKAVETCMIGLHTRLVEVVSAQMAEPAEPTLTKELAQIIVSLAENDLRTTLVADEIGISRPTLGRRLDKIREVTGKNPMSFFDLAQLLIEARMVLGV